MAAFGQAGGEGIRRFGPKYGDMVYKKNFKALINNVLMVTGVTMIWWF